MDYCANLTIQKEGRTSALSVLYWCRTKNFNFNSENISILFSVL